MSDQVDFPMYFLNLAKVQSDAVKLAQQPKINQGPRKPMEIIMRHASDDLDALHVTRGMEEAGAQVISLCPNNTKQSSSVLKFIVLARFDTSVTSFDEIDRLISVHRGEVK